MRREQLLRILAIIDEVARSPYPLADAEVMYFKRLAAAAEEYLAAMNAARTHDKEVLGLYNRRDCEYMDAIKR